MSGASGSERARSTLAFLRERIASGEWPINARIPTEPELMELLGVGRTTVREAVRSLASLGILETLPGRGTFVRSRFPVSSVLADFVAGFDLTEILVYRRALEIEAAQQAAVNRTEAQLGALRSAHQHDVRVDLDYPLVVERGHSPGQFHSLVVEASGSRLLASLYAGVMAALRKAIDTGDVVYGAPEDIRRLDHAALLAAITDGDAARAAHAAAMHADRDLIAGAAPIGLQEVSAEETAQKTGT